MYVFILSTKCSVHALMKTINYFKCVDSVYKKYLKIFKMYYYNVKLVDLM